MSPSAFTSHVLSPVPNGCVRPVRISRLSASARRFARARTLSPIANSSPLHSRLKQRMGAAIRYRLIPQAFITVSSFVRVSRPTVTSVVTSAATGRT